MADIAIEIPATHTAPRAGAIRDLGAVGVQVFTNVLGKPLTSPETLPLFDLAARELA